jgi:putative ABC transport system ATP-binding protein
MVVGSADIEKLKVLRLSLTIDDRIAPAASGGSGPTPVAPVDRHVILRDVSFTLRRGEILTVLGPSGSGKTSLLRCLNRLETIDVGGEILLDGRDIHTLPVTDLRRRVGMVFQIPALLPGTVDENLRIGPELSGLSVVPRQPGQTPMLAESAELMAKVGLDPGWLRRPASELSVGEKQRLALAQVLANQPEVLLLDEPTSALDPTSMLKIEGLIRAVHDEFRTATVVVTHNVEQAKRFNGETLVLVSGRVVACGNIHSLLANTDDPALGKFFRGDF